MHPNLTHDRLVIFDTVGTTVDALHTLDTAFRRHDIDIQAFDALTCLLLKKKQAARFKDIRERFGINPALASECSDEHSNYVAANWRQTHGQ